MNAAQTIDQYSQTRSSNSGLLDQLRAHTAALQSRLAETGMPQNPFVPNQETLDRGRHIVDNQLGIAQNLHKQSINAEIPTFEEMVGNIKAGQNEIAGYHAARLNQPGPGVWNDYNGPTTNHPSDTFDSYISRLKANHSQLYGGTHPSSGLWNPV